MTRKHIQAIFVLILGLVLGSSLTGCSARKHVKLDGHTPNIEQFPKEYEGKRIYLMNFDNSAEDTSMWYYFSRDYEFQYGCNTVIHSCFWYSFNRALVNAGMRVTTNEEPALNTPGMWITLLSITDKEFVFRVTLQKNGASVLIKKFTVTGPEIDPQARTREVMQRRAYEMIDDAITAVLTDAEFKAEFLKQPGTTETSPPPDPAAGPQTTQVAPQYAVPEGTVPVHFPDPEGYVIEARLPDGKLETCLAPCTLHLPPGDADLRTVGVPRTHTVIPADPATGSVYYRGKGRTIAGGVSLLIGGLVGTTGLSMAESGNGYSRDDGTETVGNQLMFAGGLMAAAGIVLLISGISAGWGIQVDAKRHAASRGPGPVSQSRYAAHDLTVPF